MDSARPVAKVSRISVVGVALVAALLHAGCGKRATDTRPPAELAAPADSRPSAGASTAARREVWDALYISDAHVGYSHTVFEPVTENGQPMVRIRSLQHLSMARFDQAIDMQVSLESFESPAGDVARFTCSTQAGPTAMEVIGTVSGDQVRLVAGAGEPVMRAWPADQGGLFATDQSLERFPMQPGEKRTVRVLIPILSQVYQVPNELEAIGIESTPLLARSMDLMKITSTVSIGGQTVVTLLWTTSEGQLKKSQVPALNQTTYHDVGETVARGDRDAPLLDLADLAVVRIAERLADPHRAQSYVYRLRMQSGSPAEMFPSSGGQRVERLDDRTARVVVERLRPGEPAQAEPAAQPVAADLAPNSLIQSDHPAIAELAVAVAAESADPWTVACALEHPVKRSIHQKNFSQAFATAADVVRTREGDCTEHSVLLAALCRARGIPARVAVGLVYADTVHGFAFHMWNEVWVGDRWIPLDGTLGLGGTGAGHLKLGDSNLSEGEAESAILPVIQVIGQLDISVVQ